jgi:hypothetical protein
MTLAEKLKELSTKTAQQAKVDTKAIERAKQVIEAAKQAAKTPTK